MVELRVPERYIGKTLAESAIRRNYNLTVVTIRRGTSVIAGPDPEIGFKPSDELLILGQISDAERFV